MTQLSFYIGSIKQKFTEEDIRVIFSEHRIGIVDRVDFVQPGQIGFQETVKPRSRYKTAFIYFQSFIDSDLSLAIRHSLDTGYKLFVDPKTYWLIQRNRRPLAKTLLNIHQVTDYACQLEATVLRQEMEINSMKSVITQMILNYNTHIVGILNYLTQLECQRGGQRLEQLEEIVAHLCPSTFGQDEEKTKTEKQA